MPTRRKWSDKQRRAIYLQHRRGRTHTDIAEMCKRGLASLDPFEIPRRTITDICSVMDRDHGEKEVEELERVDARCTCEEPDPDPDELLAPRPPDLPPGEIRNVPCRRCDKPLSIYHLIVLPAKFDQERGDAAPIPADPDAAREEAKRVEEVQRERPAPTPDDQLDDAIKRGDKAEIKRLLAQHSEAEARSTPSPAT